MTRGPALALVASLAVAGARPASADESRAKQLYADGKAHYDLAEYADAIAAWKEAYKLSKAPMLLFNIAQAQRLGGDCASALRSYANYEREAKKPIANAEELELARGRCNPAPTTTNVPDGLDDASRPPRALDPDPERARPRPPRTDQPRSVDAINEPPPPPVAHASTAGTHLEYAGYGVAAAGALLLGTSYYFAHAASSHASEVSSYIGEWTTTQADLAATGKRDATIGVALGVAGGAAIAGGAVLWFLGYRAHARAELAVAITPTTSEVAWRVRF